MPHASRAVVLIALVTLAAIPPLVPAQTPAPPQVPASPTIQQKTSGKTPGPPANTSTEGGKAGAQGGDSKSSADTKQSASGKVVRLGPLDPSVPPPRVFTRPRIGLALGGGGALGLTEVGVLRWLEENHIPVDVIAGTSMGCLVSSLYATGQTPEELSHIVNDKVFGSVFSFSGSFSSRSFRRREESRELPNGITVGLRHGVSFRNAVLVDQGLNAFLDREFLRYDDQSDFNTLPIPLRCISTDLNEAKAVTFARGSIPDAVRASLSIPGIFPPFEMNGHEYVDGVVLENLPTPTIRNDLKADVVLAVSIPLAPVAKGDLDSILGVFGRSFSVATEAAEVQERKLADVLMMPDITGLNVTSYKKSDELVKRGYDSAEKQRAALLKYTVSDAQWKAYLAHRTRLIRGPAAPVLQVRVTAPDHSTTVAVQHLFAPLVNQPVDTARIEAMLDQVRANGALDADYTVGYETARQYAAQTSGDAPLPDGTIDIPATTDVAPASSAAAPAGNAAPKPPVSDASSSGTPPPGAPNPKVPSASADNQPKEPEVAARPGASGLAATQEANAQSMAEIDARPILLVTVTRKKTGPPFLMIGANIEAQTNAFTRATVEGVVLDQNFGGYGSELRSNIKLGYLTELGSEYFRPINPLGSPERMYFTAPRISFLREPFPVFTGNVQVADRQYQQFDLGSDIGLTNQRTQQVRAGYDFYQLHWITTTGSDGHPDFSGQSQRIRVHYDLDTQDRALVPQYGVHVTAEAGYRFASIDSVNAPDVSAKASYAHRFGLRKTAPDAPKDSNRGHEVFIFATEGGTFFDRNVAAPYRYTLGGPLRLTASAIDQYRGTDYFLVEPAILRRIAQLPQPLGQSFYLGLGAEAGQIHAPGVPVINRQDVYFGVVAETPLGVITFAPAIGSNGERKLVFTLGKLF